MATEPHRAIYPSDAQVDYAVKQTVAALEHPMTVERIHRYYDPSTNYAGSSYLTIQTEPRDLITPADLFAISLLNVKAHPRAARRLLDNDRPNDVSTALADIPADADLATADDAALAAADALYRAIKTAIGGNPWVTASKLCARKRPNLFPVRDTVVTRDLLGAARNNLTDWHIYRALITNTAVLKHLDRVTVEAKTFNDVVVTIDDPPLRVLDVALWTYAIEQRES